MKTIVLFGGSGGLGSKLVPLLEKKYNVISLSSKDVDIRNTKVVNEFFSNNSFDIIINLSGINYNSFIHKLNPIDNLDEIKDVIDTNIYGTINVLSSCLPIMRGKKYGRVILISSVLTEKITIGTGLYASSKAFIDTITKVTSLENISYNITCNSLQLGYFDGGMTHKIDESIKEKIGLKRFGYIDELYKTINYLIETEYITGQNINISGGL